MKSRIPQAIQDNLRFLIVEVGTQVSGMQSYCSKAEPTLAKLVLDRAGYTHNLKLSIESNCHQHIAKHQQDEVNTLVIHALASITCNLQRIAQLCCDGMQHMLKLGNKQRLANDDYASLLEKVAWAISQIEQAIVENDTRLAGRIGDLDGELQRDCDKQQAKYREKLKYKKNTEDLVSALFIAHCIKHMGEALLDISDAIISGNLGQPFRREHYHSLTGMLDDLEAGPDMANLQLTTLAETRSGSSISAISSRATSENYMAVFKNGQKRKLKEEKQSVKSWHQIYPGIAPKILSYNQHGKSASLLIEHLEGVTLESLLLQPSSEQLPKAMRHLFKTLKSVWNTTKTIKPVSAGYIQQLQKRLPEVYSVHREFNQEGSRIGDYEILPFTSLVQQAGHIESRFEAPFSVYIHGDFNNDNIIFDPEEKKISFIDLHRSSHLDYVQDVSVFMVSNYRLQLTDKLVRKEILQHTGRFYRFASTFAAKHKDQDFDLRLAFGLARSFATSTRFILDRELSRKMFYRARYLLEQIVDMDKTQLRHYKLPIKEIFID